MRIYMIINLKNNINFKMKDPVELYISNSIKEKNDRYRLPN